MAALEGAAIVRIKGQLPGISRVSGTDNLVPAARISALRGAQDTFGEEMELCMKKSLAFLLPVSLLMVLGLSILGCASSKAGKGAFTPGTYEATAPGFGGDVKVSVTVDRQRITEVRAYGPAETPGIGSRAIEELPGRIVKAQGTKVDNVSGASYSSLAVKTAADQALAKARGDSPVSASLRDGSYTASARGFSLSRLLPVTVEIQGGKIATISLGASAETAAMALVVERTLVPRIIERQSLAVDAITGATATSNAVKTAVLDCCVQAGASPAALNGPKASPLASKVDYVCDVVVVGMGGSGTAAALSAAQAGAKVIAVDKAAKWGGTSAITSGPMAVNAPSQVKAEIPNWMDPVTNKARLKPAGENLVDGSALLKDWLAYTTVDGKQGAKAEIVRELIEKSGDTLDWVSSLGFAFQPARGFVGGKWAVYSPYVGDKARTEEFFASAYRKFTDELGGRCLLETTGTELLVQGGQVVGLLAKGPKGESISIKAKAVILATGGFGGSPEMMKRHLGEDWKLYGMAQNKGDGISMAMAQGGAIYNIGMPPMSHFVAPPSIITSFKDPMDNDLPYGMICSSEALAVDHTGRRFTNELDIAMNAYKVGSRFYTIYSKEQIDILRERGFGLAASGRYLSQGGVKANAALANIDAVLAEGVRQGIVFKAPSLEGIAKAIGGDMKPGLLKASLAAYGAGMATGDEFGKPADRFARLGAPNPGSEYFVAVAGAPYIYSTCGGLDVDATMRVLRKDGREIPGLYAVGTDSMGVLFTGSKGYANYGGVAQGYAFFSGRIAGAAAASRAQGK